MTILKVISIAALLTTFANASTYTYVPIPGNENIQTQLISAFPTGTFTANNALATPFSISSVAANCGTANNAPCNYYDGFGTTGNGKSITLNVSVASPTDVYTLMNAYSPIAGQQIATIKFVGSGGATLTFPLIAGQNVRDFNQGRFANTLSNAVAGMQALNAFSCVDPATCLGAGGTGNVKTGAHNVYVIDEQDFSLGATFSGQTLTQIVITDTQNGSVPILMGITIGAGVPAPPNLITNGGFETPAIPQGSALNFNSGSTGITGWTVTGAAPNTVAIVSGAYSTSGLNLPSQDGFQWLDLTGSSVSTDARGITQTVSTMPGTSYLLKFWVGNVYDSRPASTPGGTGGMTSTVAVKINGASAGSFTNSAQSTTMIWQQFSMTFNATGNSTSIEFDNLDPSTDSSNGLDNVVLQQVGTPSISAGGVVSAGAFGGFTSISPGSWIEIYGSNLASNSRSWAGSDFNGINAPTSLDGTKATIGGQPAFIDYISPTQVNALVPSNAPTGTQQLVLTSPSGTAQYNVNINSAEPGLLAPSSFNIGGVPFAVALFSDGTYVLPVGSISGVTSRPAKAGDTITLYGVGFGPVTPASPAGQLVQQLNSLSLPLQMSIGGMPVIPSYFGLAPGYAGLYQFNLTMPSVASGNAAVAFTLNETTGTQTLYIASGQ